MTIAKSKAEFILDAALAADIRVGTNGTELVMVASLRIPTAVRRSFELALEENQAEIIKCILREKPQ
jgi:hypothetical protein